MFRPELGLIILTEKEFNVNEAATYILRRGNPSVCFIFHDVDMLPVSFFQKNFGHELI